MGNYSKLTSWDVQERLSFIENCALWLGKVTRKLICERYKISLQQASADIQAYHELNPKALDYCLKSKCYLPSEEFSPVIVSLIDLQKSLNLFFPDQVDSVLIPPRVSDIPILRTLSSCLANQESLEIEYYSIHSNTKKWRRIAPHAFASDGLRWHVRAWCFENNEYRDFLPSRMTQTKNQEPFNPPHNDTAWETYYEFELTASDKLDHNARKAVELDYSMYNGSLFIQVREAMLGYTLRRFNFSETAKIGDINTSGILKYANKEVVE